MNTRRSKQYMIDGAGREFGPRIAARERRLVALQAALDAHDAGAVAAVLGAAARAKRMTRISETTGVTRASLYKSLSTSGNPGLATVLKVLRAVGITLRAVPTWPPGRRTHGAAPCPRCGRRA
jgi:probable addiction module antidote protein